MSFKIMVFLKGKIGHIVQETVAWEALPVLQVLGKNICHKTFLAS